MRTRKAWIDSTSYLNILEQAAMNNGRALIECRGGPPLEIQVDVEFAKREWAEIEKIMDRHDKRVNA